MQPKLDQRKAALYRPAHRAEGKYAETVCMTGFTFFLWNGGVEGTDCTPELDIDNIRVVPINK